MSLRTSISPSTFKRFLVGTVLEFGPILIFLSAFPHFHIYKATMLLMIATIISTIVTYRLQKRLPYMGLYVAFLTIVFGYLTLMHREPKFIQMRDTLYDLTCAATLMFGLVIRAPFLRIAFEQIIPMTNRAWNRLTYAWITFLLCGAFLNEMIRRFHSLHTWFEFKGYMIIATIVFGFATLFLFYEKVDKENA